MLPRKFQIPTAASSLQLSESLGQQALRMCLVTSSANMNNALNPGGGRGRGGVCGLQLRGRAGATDARSSGISAIRASRRAIWGSELSGDVRYV